ncbi:hypothetical protein IFM89_033347 [Coptis chinensis]|uniref:Glycosyltransferase n=1 Tax=Coptis chinensis TaxID=261450 RepID=A0A835LNH7_9MAGN|nr:hypothetical protein IFM89_033347 [Coptis chinensis]
MAQQGHQLHFLLFPFLAQGHMIPMLDIARLIAQRGVLVTIVTTPSNFLRFKTTIDRAIQLKLPIRILQLHFPGVEAGLPEGCENFDTVPSQDLIRNLFTATAMLQQPLEQSIEEMELLPSCIISDFCLPWTSETARKFNIPRLVFNGMCCFTLFCAHNIIHLKAIENVNSESEPFVIPGLPDRIEITKSRIMDNLKISLNNYNKVLDQINKAELTAYGVVINSFHDLEPMYIKGYQKAKGNKVWHVGPVSLYNKEVVDKVERGNKATVDASHCLRWLDSRKPNSVVYVCLGSLSRLAPAQFMEIGLGLETSQCSFIWVIKSGERYKELEKWLSDENFEERTKDRGLVIEGWAPQVLILSHQAIGGFLTHCGWNSTLEAVCAGVPMLTWPMFQDQFINEKLIVQVLSIGVSVEVGDPIPWGEEDKVGVLVTKEKVESAVNRLMDENDEGEGRRRKARELAELASKAMEEGGSSYLSLTLLIEDIKHEANKRASTQTNIEQ